MPGAPAPIWMQQYLVSGSLPATSPASGCSVASDHEPRQIAPTYATLEPEGSAPWRSTDTCLPEPLFKRPWPGNDQVEDFNEQLSNGVHCCWSSEPPTKWPRLSGNFDDKDAAAVPLPDTADVRLPAELTGFFGSGAPIERRTETEDDRQWKRRRTDFATRVQEVDATVQTVENEERKDGTANLIMDLAPQRARNILACIQQAFGSDACAHVLSQPAFPNLQHFQRSSPKDRMASLIELEDRCPSPQEPPVVELVIFKNGSRTVEPLHVRFPADEAAIPGLVIYGAGRPTGEPSLTFPRPHPRPCSDSEESSEDEADAMMED
eukprot:TRINITY_DN19469_c0_g1_i1.p1 TRINITY_DN19469_c0_g1~~TRINITY_DN19469_c0_g1_i1.p1  ORF type:complete len:322 (+),score=46.51 TRINITY_DN19469_c0_g1_i1:112-1077(+)